MRAGVLYAPGDLRVEDRADPVPGQGDVVVRVMYNGLCGTDATEYSKGPMLVPLYTPHPGSGHVGPTTLGHEFIGTVVDAGSGAAQWLGKRVACGAGVSCGDCAWCRRGRTNLCASYYTLGLSTHGGLAELVVAPAATLVEIPHDCAYLDAALAQPLAVGLHGVDRAGIAPGERVVLIGAGAIGSFILAGLAGQDNEVVVVDVDPARLEVARLLGATTTHLVAGDTTLDDLRDLVDDPVEVVVESSGVPGAAAKALGLAARGGRVLLVGLVKAPQELQLADVVLREVDVRTTVAHVCSIDLPRALDLLSSWPLAQTIGVTVVPLESVVADGFEPLVHGAVSGKVLVDPRRTR